MKIQKQYAGNRTYQLVCPICNKILYIKQPYFNKFGKLCPNGCENETEPETEPEVPLSTCEWELNDELIAERMNLIGELDRFQVSYNNLDIDFNLSLNNGQTVDARKYIKLLIEEAKETTPKKRGRKAK